MIDRKAFAAAMFKSLGQLQEQKKFGTHDVIRAVAYVLLDAVDKAMAEQRKAMTFCGAHDPASEYHQGDVVQRAGMVWVALDGVQKGMLPGASDRWQCIAGA